MFAHTIGSYGTAEEHTGQDQREEKAHVQDVQQDVSSYCREKTGHL